MHGDRARVDDRRAALHVREGEFAHSEHRQYVRAVRLPHHIEVDISDIIADLLHRT